MRTQRRDEQKRAKFAQNSDLQVGFRSHVAMRGAGAEFAHRSPASPHAKVFQTSRYNRE
jgi:hypothetical protein